MSIKKAVQRSAGNLFYNLENKAGLDLKEFKRKLREEEMNHREFVSGHNRDYKLSVNACGHFMLIKNIARCHFEGVKEGSICGMVEGVAYSALLGNALYYSVRTKKIIDEWLEEYADDIAIIVRNGYKDLYKEQ